MSAGSGALAAAGSLPAPAMGPSYPLAGTQWSVWGTGLLRSAGFPASGSGRFGGPRAARAAQQADGTTGYDEFNAAYQADSAAEAAQLARTAADDRLRRAIAWQNRNMYQILDSLATGDHAKVKGSKRRQRERALAMYWLRYCAKADTIGFFGPAAWISVGQASRAIECEPGLSITSDSRVFFERWMIAALGDWMAARPGARWWFPPMLRADVHLEGGQLLVPGRRTVRLHDDEVQTLLRADGSRNAEAITEALVHEQQWDPATARQRVERVLSQMLRRRIVAWDANIPVDVRAEDILRSRVAAVGDPDLSARFTAILGTLDRLREEIARAVSAEELVLALDQLDEYFTTVTGVSATREEGKAYAGRTLCYQDTLRDCRVYLGGEFLDRIARPLALVADAADWFGGRLAELVEREVAAMVRAASARHEQVALSDVWPQVLALFWGDKALPVQTATRELAEKWRAVIALPEDAGTCRVELSCADIGERARTEFATDARYAPHLAVHSPDLQVAAGSVEAVNAGDCTVVLGELHACLATLDLPFLDWTSTEGSVRDRVNAAIAAPRLVPLLPVDWARNSGRLVPAPVGAGDRLIGFTRAPYDDRARIDAAVAITLTETDGTVTAATPDGRTWSIPELLGVPISVVAADAFKIGLDRPHTPRATLDGLVLFRETWRMPLSAVALPARPDRHADYLAVRRWIAECGLPDRAFAKFAGETKPSLLDFTSPTLVLSFANFVRRSLAHDAEAVVTLSEPLPVPEDSWLQDSAGERYVSELRLQISRKAPQ